MSHTKKKSREYRKERIRKKINGGSGRPRLSVFRSINHFYAQLIDDEQGKTLLSVSTIAKDFANKKDAGNVKGAKELGKLVAEKAIGKKIEQVVFDRGGFLYHGRIKAFAEGAREGGLKF
ncbi:MAG: 50S ribosomal protein L18 [Deltaproteobacteria bacterium]|nr:MAG: 50S ribosomal protein L18 [Deltaproteobacteria bacterium]